MITSSRDVVRHVMSLKVQTCGTATSTGFVSCCGKLKTVRWISDRGNSSNISCETPLYEGGSVNATNTTRVAVSSWLGGGGSLGQRDVQAILWLVPVAGSDSSCALPLWLKDFWAPWSISIG